MITKKRNIHLTLQQFEDLAQHVSLYDDSGILQTYLDITTGDIAQYSTDTHVPLGLAADLSDTKLQEFEAEKTVKEQIETSPNRYLQLYGPESSVSFHYMEQFIETVEDKNIMTKLTRAIQGKSPFRRFKDILIEYPIVREHWFRFEERMHQGYVLEWLSGMGFEVILLPKI